MLHLLIPAAGESQRFADAGYEGPKGLLKMRWRGKRRTMIEHVVDSVNLNVPPIIGCKLSDGHRFIEALPKDYIIAPITRTAGQADTVYQMSRCSHIHTQDALAVVNSDNAFSTWRITQFINHCYMHCEIRVGTVVFEATEPHYGYIDDFPEFNRGAEKDAISSYALAGAFYFSSQAMLDKAWQKYTNKRGHEAYLSGLFSLMPKTKTALLIDRRDLHEWGTPQSIALDNTVSELDQPTGVPRQ